MGAVAEQWAICGAIVLNVNFEASLWKVWLHGAFSGFLRKGFSVLKEVFRTPRNNRANPQEL